MVPVWSLGVVVVVNIHYPASLGQPALAALVTLIVLGPRFPCLVSVMICGEAAWTSKHTHENMYAYFYAASS